VGIVAIGGLAASFRMHRFVAYGVVVMLVCLVTARSVDAWVILHQLDPQVADIRNVLGSLPRGQRLLVAEADDTAPGRVAPQPMTNNLGMLATLDRDAFVPFFFTGVTQVELQPRMQRSASIGSRPLTLQQFHEGFANPDPGGKLPPFDFGGQKFWLGWPKKFDYVLLLHFGSHVDDLPPVLRLVTAGSVANLYRIVGP
jgi:hypothetical protein